MRRVVDALIVGSGFSGSLLGWILGRQGWGVTIVDAGRHPKFAIGESSTPTADFLLAHLADRWSLTGLAPLACWGSWQATYPELVCGKKRGFSYYRHFSGQPFRDDESHSNSLLVAASCDDRWSDTHWLRSSVDAFIARRAVATGAELVESTRVTEAFYDDVTERWRVTIAGLEGRREIVCRWLLDASGGGAASAAFVDNPPDEDWMRTRTRASYAHFRNVKPFASEPCPEASFAGDDAAQHHILDDGWCWMLRMNNGVTSVGVVEDLFRGKGGLWRRLGDFPSIAEMLSAAEQVASLAGSAGGDSRLDIGGDGGGVGLITTGRISRCRRTAAGAGWALLPAAYGVVDPLHSTGIAHSLSGVARVAEILTGDTNQIAARLAGYDRELRAELRWIDTMVAGCYRSLPSFSRLTAFASWYFVAAIGFESAMVADPTRWPLGFLGCQDQELIESAERSLAEVCDSSLGDSELIAAVRRRIEPWNHVGLLDPTHRNRLRHTTAPKYALLG